jgi:multimeric flavodoxin WrbA
MVKILGLCGSPRKGATEYLIKEALNSIVDNENIETEFISLAGKKIEPCNNCNYCRRNKTWCCIKDDANELLQKFLEADAYIIGSPVYVYSVTPQLLAFFTRMRPVFHIFPEKLRNKFGAALATGGKRNGGQEIAVNTVANLMMARGINVVSNEVGGYAGAYLWSKDLKEVGAAEDENALESARKLANKLAEVTLIYDLGKKQSKLL